MDIQIEGDLGMSLHMGFVACTAVELVERTL